MNASLSIVRRFDSCRGSAVVLARHGGLSDAPAFALAAMLGELEATGVRADVVCLAVRSREDAQWIVPALDWLVAHGRWPVIRSAMVMPATLVAAAARTHATWLLELAHAEPRVQRALLGQHAEPAAALLLQAQHLATRAVPVGVQLGPLVPGLHEDAAQLDPLLQNIAAAAVGSVRPYVGRLGRGRLQALREVVDAGRWRAITRAYGLDVVDRASAPDAVDGDTHTLWRAPPRVEVRVLHGTRHRIAAKGLTTSRCNCPLQCHLTKSVHTSPYVSVLGPGLFERTAG